MLSLTIIEWNVETWNLMILFKRKYFNQFNFNCMFWNQSNKYHQQSWDQKVPFVLKIGKKNGLNVLMKAKINLVVDMIFLQENEWKETKGIEKGCFRKLKTKAVLFALLYKERLEQLLFFYNNLRANLELPTRSQQPFLAIHNTTIEMKIMVAIKRVVDYAVKIRVKPDRVRSQLINSSLLSKFSSSLIHFW